MIGLPTPPDVTGMSNVSAASTYGLWLIEVARKCGEPAVRRAVGEQWPGTAEQRALLAPGHIEAAIGEARTVANETWAKEARAKGRWGV